MKVRNDFVTNSSSSSFIISTDAEIPVDYAQWVEKITPEVVKKIIKETSNYEWSPISYSISEEDIKKLGNFTDDQIFLIRLIQCDQLERYQKLLKWVAESDKPLYYIYANRDWLYDNYILEKFITSGEILEHETDL